MIKNIVIKNFATYDDVIIGNLDQINFFFGHNGSGKSTIARIISNIDTPEYKDSLKGCKVTWQNETPLDILIYNKEFINKYFAEDSIKGIFTLGKESINTKDQLEKTENLIKKIDSKISSLKIELNNIKTDKSKTNISFYSKMWDICKPRNSAFKAAFQGSLKSEEIFGEELLKMYKKYKNENIDFTEADLSKDYHSTFVELKSVEAIPEISKYINDLRKLDISNALSQIIVGKGDAYIKNMIENLGNSDWVKQGKEYYDKNNDYCPFCQEKPENNLKKALEDYFDNSFISAKENLNKILLAYDENSKNIISAMQSIIDKPNAFVDTNNLKILKENFETTIKLNINLLKQKIDKPSQSIIPEPLEDTISEIEQVFSTCRDKIIKHNKIIENLVENQSKVITKVWLLIINNNRESIEMLLAGLNTINKKIKIKDKTIAKLEYITTQLNQDISILYKDTINIEQVKNNINDILKKWGFNSFKISSTDDKLKYKIIREDGSLALDTISEGERNFLTFVYFYSLIDGSFDKKIANNNKVIVIDDPVSSLDNNMMFVITNMIRYLFSKISKKPEESSIKQIIILTHNVFFHQQVTYKVNKGRHYIVSKDDDHKSIVKSSGKNPISSSYQMLWKDIKETQNINAMRRAIEYYFAILGTDDSINNLNSIFSGNDLLLYQYLISLLHIGSHGVFEDTYYSTENKEECLRIFEEIFRKSGHEAHYKMMMGDSNQ